jgi:hypothetical protein
VCHFHGANAPQTARRADYRLSISELMQSDPRPLREVLRSAVHVADSAMRDLEQSVVHDGETSAATISRLLEAAKYSAGVARLALDSGLVVDPVPPASLEQLVDLCTAALAHVLDALTLDELPTARAVQLRKWAVDAIGEYLAAVERGEPPSGPPPKPVPFGLPPPPLNRWTSRPSPEDEGVVDAELVDDDDTDEPGDEALSRELVELRLLVGPR